jgi:hypothetical protein
MSSLVAELLAGGRRRGSQRSQQPSRLRSVHIYDVYDNQGAVSLFNVEWLSAAIRDSISCEAERIACDTKNKYRQS